MRWVSSVDHSVKQALTDVPVTVPMPIAKLLTILIIATMTEHEAEMMSARAKAALSTAKARRTKLGSVNPKIREYMFSRTFVDCHNDS